MSLQSQFERSLEEWREFLDAAETKLRSDDVTAVDLTHLQQQIKSHKVRNYSN